MKIFSDEELAKIKAEVEAAGGKFSRFQDMDVVEIHYYPEAVDDPTWWGIDSVYRLYNETDFHTFPPKPGEIEEWRVSLRANITSGLARRAEILASRS